MDGRASLDGTVIMDIEHLKCGWSNMSFSTFFLTRLHYVAPPVLPSTGLTGICPTSSAGTYAPSVERRGQTQSCNLMAKPRTVAFCVLAILKCGSRIGWILVCGTGKVTSDALYLHMLLI